MMDIRPIVYDENNVILGGNMRYRALQELETEGLEVKDSWFLNVKDLTEQQKKEFIIKDNVGFGEWDYDILANEWDSLPLDEWGLSVPMSDDGFYTRNVKAPIYEPTNEKPDLDLLIDKKKVNELIEEINKLDIEEDIKEFLRISAYRHYVFNYSKIADYYANSSPDIQNLMEKSALVIIDLDKAIENNYIKFIKNILEIQNTDYEE